VEINILPVVSARFSKLLILCVNDLLDGDFCKNIFYFHISLFFLVFNPDFISDALILPVGGLSPLQTQRVMTSQIRSHIEY